jgi:hypothetical protein
MAREAMTAEALAARVHSAALHLLRRLAQEDRALGISAPRLSALSVLGFGGPRTIGSLASVEGVTPPTMTRLVAGMAADGLVERLPDESDGGRASRPVVGTGLSVRPDWVARSRRWSVRTPGSNAWPLAGSKGCWRTSLIGRAAFSAARLVGAVSDGAKCRDTDG